MRDRADALRNPMASLPLWVGDRLVASIVVLRMDPWWSSAMDEAILGAFRADAALALRRAIDGERPTLRPIALR
jgi:hypothetical protein